MIDPTQLKDSREVEVFKKFISTRKVLIADPSAASRSGLFQVFRELGAQSNQLLLVNNFNQAQQSIVDEKPHIVVAEYEIGKRCGLELLQSQREQRPNETKECLFVVVTGNTSQTAVARSAEEDIDAYIIKPYTIDSVRKTIMKAMMQKVKPSDYFKLIDEGKKALVDGKLDEAEKLFTQASTLDKSPSLAFYYLGQLKYYRKILDQAKGSYEKGLQFNKIHYKCMVGLYELLMTQKEHANAYEVVKRISQYFPANPKRLAEVLRLAVINGKYEDIERYYNVFTNIDDKNEELIKYICAALVVCGKYYLSTKLGNTRAVQLFQKAAVSGSGRTKILREIILSLIDHGITKEAHQFLTRFPPETQNKPEYNLMRFLIMNAEGAGGMVIDLGRQLISEGVVDERLFSIMIERSHQAGLVAAADSILQTAVKHFPAKQVQFQELFQKSTPAPKKEKQPVEQEK